MPAVHFRLQCFEVVRDTRPGLAAHTLPCPLFEPIQLPVDVHRADESSNVREATSDRGFRSKGI